MKSGLSELELVSRAPDYSSGPYVDCTVFDDFVAVDLHENRLLLINWRTRSRIVVSHNSQIAVVPGYLILCLRGSHNKRQLAVSPFASLASQWEPNDAEEEPSAQVTAANLSIGVHKSVALTGHLCDARVWVYENPLQTGRFKVWLTTLLNDARTLCSYEFMQHGPGIEVSWRFVSAIPMAEKWIHVHSISLSGHILGRRRHYSRLFEIFPPVPPKKNSVRRRTGPFPVSHYVVHLSSFTGALTYSTNKDIVIVYYD